MLKSGSGMLITIWSEYRTDPFAPHYIFSPTMPKGLVSYQPSQPSQPTPATTSAHLARELPYPAAQSTCMLIPPSCFPPSDACCCVACPPSPTCTGGSSSVASSTIAGTSNPLDTSGGNSNAVRNAVVKSHVTCTSSTCGGTNKQNSSRAGYRRSSAGWNSNVLSAAEYSTSAFFVHGAPGGSWMVAAWWQATGRPPACVSRMV